VITETEDKANTYRGVIVCYSIDANYYGVSKGSAFATNVLCIEVYSYV
jgi:hypothetical protein